MAAQYHAAGPHDLVLAYTRDRLYRDRLAQVCVCVCVCVRVRARAGCCRSRRGG